MKAHPRRELLFALAALAALGPVVPAAGAERVLTLDPAASRVEFSVPATGHAVHGAFALRSGTVRFDPVSGQAGGEIVVDARGAKTGNASRDRTMHQKVLESSRFPRFELRPERLEGELAGAGTSQVRLVGTLVLHGAEHPLTLPATVKVDGDRVEADGSFPVPYAAWGLHNPSLLFLRVADVVEVTVHVAGRLEDAREPRSAARSASSEVRP
ncbi:MAG TPA: YceI family protein [Thermoanaerobaculia bacterium]